MIAKKTKDVADTNLANLLVTDSLDLLVANASFAATKDVLSITRYAGKIRRSTVPGA